MLAREKRPVLQVWQHTGMAVLRIPAWVSGCTEWHGDGLYLVRASGKQLIDSSDWLVEDSDGDILWLPNDRFQRQYEPV